MVRHTTRAPPSSKSSRKPTVRSSSYSDDYRVTPELGGPDRTGGTSFCSGSCCPPPASYRELPASHCKVPSSSRYSFSPSRYSSSPSRYSSSPSRQIQSSSQRWRSPGPWSRTKIHHPTKYVSPQRGATSPVRSVESCSTCCSSCYLDSPLRSEASGGSPYRAPRHYSRHEDSATGPLLSQGRRDGVRRRTDRLRSPVAVDSERVSRAARRPADRRQICEEHSRLLSSGSHKTDFRDLPEAEQKRLIREYVRRHQDSHDGRSRRRSRQRDVSDGGGRRSESRGGGEGGRRKGAGGRGYYPLSGDGRERSSSGGGEKEDVGGYGGGRRKGGESSGSIAVSNKDILHHMVNKTKAQKKHIRSLENEVERLRGTDVLAQCEVRQRDVEWRPGDVLGEGSFSTVYRGTFCGIEVAVKELKLKLSQDDKNYFRSEAALLQQLHHPRVVLLMGVCTGAARPFMLLEYMQGGSLHTLIHGQSSIPAALDHATYFCVARDVAQGINYLHKHDPQVLHLDLKSMNVLLDAYTRAKIADFGFSILRRSRSPAQRGAIRGTPAWMAPELLTKGEVSCKCDVYSYAIILWEMLTSEQPFRGYDVLQILEAVESGLRPPLPPSSAVSRELRELITSCWAQNPSLRPSFSEILGALEEASVPPSWRGLLQRAHLPTSLPNDPPAARTVISAVQESVETLRRTRRTTRSASARGNASNVVDESVKNRSIAQSSSRNIKRNSSRVRDRSIVVNDRRKLRDRSRDLGGRKYTKNEVSGKKKPTKLRNGKPIISQGNAGPDKNEERRRQRKESPKKSGRDVSRQIPREKSSNSRRDSNKDVASDSLESLRDSLEDDKIWKHAQRNKKSPSDAARRRDSVGESQYSSWSSDDIYTKPYSKYDSEGRQTPPVHKNNGTKRSTSPRRSPTRKPTTRQSPERSAPSARRRTDVYTERQMSPVRTKSPTKRRPEEPRRKNEMKLGLALTAEQLLKQKMKLKPVPPSNLPDISDLPEKSLQDLSKLLRKAMSRRRDALPQSLPSDDQCSDWR